jgi:hypothetical protein
MRPVKVSSEGLATGLLALATALLACLSPAQSDTWWLLRAGQEILSTGAIPLIDTYSWTAAGLYWPNHEWLTELTFHVLHARAGMPGVAMLCATAIMSAALIAWRLGEGSFELRFGTYAVALVASTSVFALRPQVFTLAAFSLTCLWLRLDRLWSIPALIVIWVNFHGAAVLGPVAVAAACVSDLLPVRGDADERRRTWPRLAAVVAAATAATLVSPLGVRLWTFIPESTARSRVNQLVEWTAPGLSPQYAPFWLAALALLALTIWRVRWLDLHRRRIVAVSLAMLPLAAQSVRNIPIFLLAALPAITMLAAAREARATESDPGRPRPARSQRENLRVNAVILAALIVLAAIGVALTWMRPPPMLQWQPMSAAAAQAIAGCGAPLYNTYNRGGEIIWFVPEQTVFVDNRQDPYPLEVLAAAKQVERGGGFVQLASRYGIRCAAVPPDSAVAGALRSADDWAAVYEDRLWLVMKDGRPR